MRRLALAASVGFVAADAVVGVFVGAYAGQVIRPAGHSITAPAPSTPGTGPYVAAHHGCWTDSAGLPADMSGKVPGHVVVSRGGPAGPVTYGGAALVHLALEQLFSGHPHGLTVWGFCR